MRNGETTGAQSYCIGCLNNRGDGLPHTQIRTHTHTHTDVSAESREQRGGHTDLQSDQSCRMKSVESTGGVAEGQS